MKIVFVRHGEPDYEKDSLTEKGWKEAELLAPLMKKIGGDKFYMSPLGRAKDTAHTALKGTGIEPEIRDWMREFYPKIERPDMNGAKSPICWDWLPEDWANRPGFYDYDKWGDEPEMKKEGVREEYDKICKGLDELLKENGYEKEGNLFHVTRANNDTIVIFCHFGLTCLCLSYLLHISPMVLWQGFIMAPTSITTVVSEERRNGKACFRVSSLGDVSHLYAGNEEPSFAGRFCECFSNEDERHD